MAKITYLLGAGASANAIPVVADMHNRMNEMLTELKEIKTQVENPSPSLQDWVHKKTVQNIDALTFIINELDWLCKEAGNYFTIDTLAKKFYLTENFEGLDRLKRCLVIYFTLEQYIFFKSKPNDRYHFSKSNIDRRYSNFIAAIAKIKAREIGKDLSEKELDERIGIELPEDIKIISWNYDLQFEINLNRFFIKKKIRFSQNSIQIYPNEKNNFTTGSSKSEANSFSMVKLNGNAIWDMKEEYQPLAYTETVFDYYHEDADKSIFLGFFLEKFQRIRSYNHSVMNTQMPVQNFHFAWEHKEGSLNLEVAEAITSDTEILVVIGYSFPIFNREIDNRLFNNMQKLKKVYIQDKDPARIKSTMENSFKIFQDKKEMTRIKSVSSNTFQADETKVTEYELEPRVNILLEPYTDQFVIPYELNQ